MTTLEEGLMLTVNDEFRLILFDIALEKGDKAECLYLIGDMDSSLIKLRMKKRLVAGGEGASIHHSTSSREDMREKKNVLPLGDDDAPQRPLGIPNEPVIRSLAEAYARASEGDMKRIRAILANHRNRMYGLTHIGLLAMENKAIVAPLRRELARRERQIKEGTYA